MKETEWGMVGLGIILGAGFALVMGFIAHLLSEFWHKGTCTRRFIHSSCIIQLLQIGAQLVPL